MAHYLIGIDVGTTGTKSMLLREDGRVLAHAYSGYPLKTPASGLSEQDAEDWWRALRQTVRELVEETGLGAEVTALSLSTQGGTLVPVDEKGAPVRPAIVWNDRRCVTQRDDFAERLGEDRMYLATGWRLGAGLNALQIAWLRENEPGAFSRSAHFLSVHDFLSYRLTGIRAVDMSNAGINQLADIQKGAYDAEVLSFAGIDESSLAALTDSGKAVGPLSRQAAQELGLTEKTLLVAGAHDQYAACLGAGLTDPGSVMIGSGTAWVVTALVSRPDFSKGFAQSRAASRGVWGSLISLSTGGVCLDWLLKSVIGPEPAPAKADYGSINQQVSRRQPGTEGLMFFPYFGGASFPVPQADWRASFIGLDLSHDRYDMARAVMEGVACHIAWVLEQFPLDDGKAVVLSGGAGKSQPWRQMLADILNRPLRVPEQPDLPCIGAAILAGLGSGVFVNVHEALERIAPDELLIKPDRENAKRYQAHQTLYRGRVLALAKLYAD